MRKTVLVLFAVSVVARAEIVRISPKFQKDQVLNIELSRSREDSRQGRASGASITPVRVQVLEVSETGYLLDWTYGDPQFSDPAAAKNPIVQAASQALKDLHLEVVLNAEGEFKGLRNELQVKQRLEEFARRITGQILSLLPESQRGQFTQVIQQVLSPNVLLAGATRDMGLLFNLSGAEVETGKPVKMSLETANPLGAGKIQSQIEVAVVAVNAARKEAAIEFRQTFDPSTMTQMMTPMLKALLPAGSPMKVDDLPKATLFDTAEYMIDTDRNWIKRVKHVRTTQAGDLLRRVDTSAKSRSASLPSAASSLP